MVIGNVSVRDVSEAAFVRFCLLQKMDDSQVVVVYDHRPSHFAVGVVATEENSQHVKNVLKTLDSYDIYYETDFNLPTT